MKAVILAAGKGTRMRNAYGDIPKALIPINKTPFIQYLITNLHAAGIDDLALIVNYRKESIEAFLKASHIGAALITQPNTSGTGAAVASAKGFVGDEPFLVVNGDNLYSAEDLKTLSRSENAVAVVRHEEPQRFGVIKERGNRLIEIVEKPQKFIGNKINTGLFSFTPEIFRHLAKLKPSPRGEIELTDGVNHLAQETKVTVIEIKDYFIDIGNPEQARFAEAFIKKLQEEKCL